ncbi:MAG: hypothetical protein M1834_004315 [Cirrosporium novae-zelandiae]|nr:MAG: hypothetical protein M1834_004315 [Cirrosporium novae-zelandiae]
MTFSGAALTLVIIVPIALLVGGVAITRFWIDRKKSQKPRRIADEEALPAGAIERDAQYEMRTSIRAEPHKPPPIIITTRSRSPSDSTSTATTLLGSPGLTKHSNDSVNSLVLPNTPKTSSPLALHPVQSPTTLNGTLSPTSPGLVPGDRQIAVHTDVYISPMHSPTFPLSPQYGYGNRTSIHRSASMASSATQSTQDTRIYVQEDAPQLSLPEDIGTTFRRNSKGSDIVMPSTPTRPSTAHKSICEPIDENSVSDFNMETTPRRVLSRGRGDSLDIPRSPVTKPPRVLSAVGVWGAEIFREIDQALSSSEDAKSEKRHSFLSRKSYSSSRKSMTSHKSEKRVSKSGMTRKTTYDHLIS